jgi:hypothetical protein
MKLAATTALLFLLGTTASAQFSIQPQVGFEQSKTSVLYNGLPSFSPLGREGSLKAALRMDYRFKKGFGPYASFGSSPAVVAFSFANPSDALANYKATASSLQWRLEGGYQYSSKPLNLKKGSTKTVASKAPAQRTQVTSKCGSNTYRSSCGSKKVTETYQKAKNNNLTMRLQPSVGVAYIPSVKDDFTNAGNTTTYNAGNWKTALVSGMGLEFGKGKHSLLTLSVFYVKGLTNLDTKTFTKLENGKPSTGTFKSSASSWGMTVGVPFTFAKKTKTVAKPAQKNHHQSKCGSSYKSIRHI